MSAGTLRRRAGPGVFFLAAIISATIGFAKAEDCSPFEDKQRLLAFGRFELGDNRSRLQPDAGRQEGCSSEATDAYDCIYRDKDGVLYFVYEGTIVQKDIEDLAQYTGPALIADIKANDTLSTVLREFRSLPDDFPDWWAWAGTGEDDEHIYLSPAACLMTAGRVNWYYDLIFSKDARLIVIKSMFESPL